MDFELIKGRIQRYSRSSQVVECLDLLNGVQQAGQKNYPFWNALVLLKWILLHGSDTTFQSHATKRDIIGTLNLVEKFEGGQKVIDFSKGLERGMKIIAFQQFWAQNTITNDSFDRQLVLYTKINRKTGIDKEFTTLTGIGIVDFVNLLYVAYIFLITDRVDPRFKYTGVLDQNYKNASDSFFGTDLTNRFLKLLTVTSLDDVQSMQKMANESYQLYEPSFWSLKPFLVVNQQLTTPHRTVFEETVRYFIYNFLKPRSERFAEEFGYLMEGYIDVGLKELGIDYLREKDLKREYPNLKKICDFMIENNVLVETKAIELHPRSGILRDRDLLVKDLETSIVKSYIQLISTANSIDPSRDWYGIIVTYKETYIGFGAAAWNEFLKDPIEAYLRESGITKNPVPPENICVINLEDWDWIIQNVKDGKGTVLSILKTALDRYMHTDPSKKILFFEQSMRLHYRIHQFNLGYLNDAHRLIRVPGSQ